MPKYIQYPFATTSQEECDALRLKGINCTYDPREYYYSRYSSPLFTYGGGIPEKQRGPKLLQETRKINLFRIEKEDLPLYMQMAYLDPNDATLLRSHSYHVLNGKTSKLDKRWNEEGSFWIREDLIVDKENNFTISYGRIWTPGIDRKTEIKSPVLIKNTAPHIMNTIINAYSIIRNCSPFLFEIKFLL